MNAEVIREREMKRQSKQLGATGALIAVLACCRVFAAEEQVEATAQVARIRSLIEKQLRPARDAGQWDEALQAGRSALDLCRGIQDESVRNAASAFCYHAIGETWFASGENGHAEESYRKALSYCAGPPYEGSIAASLLNALAALDMAEGRREQALTNLESALKALEKSQATNVAAQRSSVYANLGSVYQSQKDFDRALQFFRRAAEAESGTPQQQAIRLNNMGGVLLAQRKLEEARAKFQAALDLDRQGAGDPARLATRYNNLALTYLTQDPPDLAQAEAQLAKAGEGLNEAARVYPLVLANNGRVYLLRGRLEEAEACLQRSATLALSRRAWEWAANALQLLGDLHSARFQATQEAGRLLPAVACYSQAAEILEQLRGQVAGGDEDRALFWESHADVYSALLRVLLDLSKHPDRFVPALAAGKGDSWDALALHWAERSRNKNLVEMLRGREVGREKAKGREAREAVSQRLRAWQALHEESAERRFAAREKQAWEAYHEAVLEAKVNGQEEFLSLRTVLPSSVSEIQRRLRPDEALVEYFIAEDWSMVLVATREAVKAVRLPADRQTITDTVEAWRDRVAEAGASAALLSTARWQKPAKVLYDLLIAPAWPLLQGKARLTIVPHGILHHLPFEALVVRPDPAPRRDRVPTPKYLCDEGLVIRYAPSASVLKYAEATNAGRLGSALVAGNAVYPPGVGSLPRAETEAIAVAKIFGSKPYLHQEATERLVKDSGPSCDLLHFATHGELDQAFPLASRLLFTADKTEDGQLTVGEVFNQDLRAYMVTLSACETGKVIAPVPGRRLLAGDDVIGLSRAFLYAGTPSVVCSLWKVNDRSTAWLMERLYAALTASDRRDKAVALQQARDAVRRRTERLEGVPVQNPYAHPFFWAPFVLIGDWR